LETFKEIVIGGLSKEELLARLESAGVQFNAYAKILFEDPKFIPPTDEETVKLVKLKFGDLNLTNPLSLAMIIDQALKLGLKLCPLYLGAFLRLEYVDQAAGSYLTIISAELAGDEQYPSGFYIRNFENAIWLRGYRAKGEADWPVDHEFIFMTGSATD
jgi:hypothetical protein